jgi:hypothetical protein
MTTTKKIIIGIVALLVIFLIIAWARYIPFFASFISMGTKSDPDILERVYLEHSAEFNQIANDFMESKDAGTISGLRINVDNDNSTCEFVGDCRKCPDDINWECSMPKYPQQKVEISSFQEVLERQSFTEDEYNKYANFLRKYHLNSITIHSVAQDHPGMLEFSYMLMGLRYESDSNYGLVEDNEYQYVKKLNDHWYVYGRDWN